MRIIDADAVEKKVYEDLHYHAELEDWEFDVVAHYLDTAKAIDAETIVRCKNCKNLCALPEYNHFAGECSVMGIKVTEDFFCAFGVNK